MTRYILLVAALAFALTNCHAQDFKPTLKKVFDQYENTQDQQQKIALGNKLDLIAKKWDKEWLAHYYDAFAKAQMSYYVKDEDKRDAYIDEAEDQLHDAVSVLKKDNDETYVLAAMIANARLAVKPQNRWQKYGKIFRDDLKNAKEMNPDNPRIYFLEGMSKFHTPKMFGGGAKNAKPYFEKAAGLFDKENDADITHPYWGKKLNGIMLEQCNNGKE